MVTSRGAFFLGLSLIICVAMFIYGPQMGKLRYVTIPTNQGVFILDTKTQMLNLCNAKSCRVVPQSGGMVVSSMSPMTYGQISGPAPMNSLGVVENNSMLPSCIGCNVGGYGNGYSYVPMQQPRQTPPPQPRVRMNENELAALRAEERALGL